MHSSAACQTEECVHTAARDLSKIDRAIHPCDDFYGFVCGRFVNETVLRSSNPYESDGSIAQNQIYIQLIRMLTDGPTNGSRSLALAKRY